MASQLYTPNFTSVYTTPAGGIDPRTGLWRTYSNNTTAQSDPLSNPLPVDQWSSTSSNTPPPDNGLDLFQPDLVPIDQTWNNSNSSNFSNSDSVSTNRGSSSSSSKSSDFSGLDQAYRDAIMGAVSPNLQESIRNLNNVPDQYANDASRMYELQARRSLEQTMPQVMEALGMSNMLNSSTSENAQSDAYQNIISDMAAKSMDAKMKAGEMEMTIPSILAGIAELGKYSSGQSQSSSKSSSSGDSVSTSRSEGKSTSEGGSLKTDPLDPYRFFVDSLYKLGDQIII